MSRLSAFMIALNEETRIMPALESLTGLADEIIVVDGGSQDRTVEICRMAGAKVISRLFTDYADQKNFAMAQASGDWLLSIDADEAVTPELAKEIRAVIADGSAAAYKIHRRSRIFGRWFRFSGTQSDAPTRLFHKGAARFEQAVHETVHVDGVVLKLKRDLEHRTYDTVSQYMARFNRYTSMEAASAPPGEIHPKRLLSRAGVFFGRQYFVQAGFRDGVPGFIFAVFSAYYVVIKRLKAWEKGKTA